VHTQEGREREREEGGQSVYRASVQQGGVGGRPAPPLCDHTHTPPESIQWVYTVQGMHTWLRPPRRASASTVSPPHASPRSPREHVFARPEFGSYRRDLVSGSKRRPRPPRQVPPSNPPQITLFSAPETPVRPHARTLEIFSQYFWTKIFFPIRLTISFIYIWSRKSPVPPKRAIALPVFSSADGYLASFIHGATLRSRTAEPIAIFFHTRPEFSRKFHPQQLEFVIYLFLAPNGLPWAAPSPETKNTEKFVPGPHAPHPDPIPNWTKKRLPATDKGRPKGVAPIHKLLYGLVRQGARAVQRPGG